MYVLPSPFPFRYNSVVDVFFNPATIADVYEFHIRNSYSRGIDKIGPNKFEVKKTDHFFVIENKCCKGVYRFSPYMEKLSSKGRGKCPRVISIPTIRDRVVLRILKEILNNYYPEHARRKLPNEVVREIIKNINLCSDEEIYVKKIDISNFYGSLNHDILLNKLRGRIQNKIIIDLLHRAITNKTVASGVKKSVYQNDINEIGVPQGLSISNILAEIYLGDIEELIKKECMLYCRYVDDILIFYKKSNKLIVDGLLWSIFNSLKLEINKSKSKDYCAGESFEYLGYLFSGDTISVRQSSVARYINSTVALFTKFSRLLESDKVLKDAMPIWMRNRVFIDELNEKITGAISENKRYGWVFYFSEINDKKLLYQIDWLISHRFSKLKAFGMKRPDSVKRLVRTYFEVKHNQTGGYIHNYEVYKTVKDKIKYLAKRGVLRRMKKELFTEEEINKLFNKVRRRNLARLDKDVGLVS